MGSRHYETWHINRMKNYSLVQVFLLDKGTSAFKMSLLKGYGQNDSVHKFSTKQLIFCLFIFLPVTLRTSTNQARNHFIINVFSFIEINNYVFL